MNNILFAHINYTNPSKTFEEYQALYNKEVKFLSSKKWHRIPKHIDPFNLITEHPYFKRLTIKEWREYLYEMHERLNKCENDNEMIKYYFNKYEDINSVRNKVYELRQRIYC